MIFNLSEKISSEVVIGGVKSEDIWIHKKDVKEFIRLRNQEELDFLKALMKWNSWKKMSIFAQENVKNRLKEINENRLAGEKLI